MGSEVAILCCAGLFFMAPVVLQGTGLFTTKWASNSTCDNIGLVVSCCPDKGDDSCELNPSTDGKIPV